MKWDKAASGRCHLHRIGWNSKLDSGFISWSLLFSVLFIFARAYLRFIYGTKWQSEITSLWGFFTNSISEWFDSHQRQNPITVLFFHPQNIFQMNESVAGLPLQKEMTFDGPRAGSSRVGLPGIAATATAIDLTVAFCISKPLMGQPLTVPWLIPGIPHRICFFF